ncbi:unnamed protein product [Urochloa decumbens]|uniref:poly(A)-specific ribonuclease n=1 Tax=Urochloa decumbens TaxID=240449 RepID=A0ABC9DI35_9POAL
MFRPPAQPFWHPGAMPPPFYHGAAPLGVPMAPHIGVPVRTVWAANLDAEMVSLRALAARARFIAFAVHYPGVVFHAGAGAADHNTLTEGQRYAAIKANADALKPLQVGLAVATHDGRCLAWEFNLSGFDRAGGDPHDAGSVEYLVKARGMDLDAHRARGIPAGRLAGALGGCGLLRRRDLTWICYAGAYHAAYLLKVVTGGLPLPGDVAGFLAAMQQLVGREVYDVARMARDCPDMPVGLERVAGCLGLAPALDSPRLAGAGAVLALQAFLSLVFGVFHGDVNMYRGLLQGLQVT